jgi:hypothetical protein
MIEPYGSAGTFEELFDACVRTERDFEELHGLIAGRAVEGLGSLVPLAILPVPQRCRGFDIGGFVDVLPEHAPGLLEIAGLPARWKEAAVAHRLEVLVGNVSQESTDEREHGHGLEVGLATLRIVLEGKRTFLPS